MTSTVPFPWEGFLFLCALFITPLAAIYLLVGKKGWFRTLCKLWSFGVVFGIVGWIVWDKIKSITISDEARQTFVGGLVIIVSVGLVIGGIIFAIWLFFDTLDRICDTGRHKKYIMIDKKTGEPKLDKNGKKIITKRIPGMDLAPGTYVDPDDELCGGLEYSAPIPNRI